MTSLWHHQRWEWCREASGSNEICLKLRSSVRTRGGDYTERPHPLVTANIVRVYFSLCRTVSGGQTITTSCFRWGTCLGIGNIFRGRSTCLGGGAVVTDATSQTGWEAPGLQEWVAWRRWRPRQWRVDKDPSSSCQSETGSSLGRGRAGWEAGRRWWGSQTKRPLPPASPTNRCLLAETPLCRARGLATTESRRSSPTQCRRRTRSGHRGASTWTPT